MSQTKVGRARWWPLGASLVVACAGHSLHGDRNSGAGGGTAGLNGSEPATGGSAQPVGGAATTQPAQGGSAEAGAHADAGASGCTTPPPGEVLLSSPSSWGNPGWKSSFFFVGCLAKSGAYCQNLASCPPGGVKTAERYAVLGSPGQNYKVTFTFHAVAEPKVYQSGQRDEPDLPAGYPNGVTDSFYRDGAPSDSDFGSWKLVVFDHTAREARHFYLNSVPAGTEAPLTFLASYSKAIVVVGGGYIEHSIELPACRAVDNCGPGELVDEKCAAPRLLPDEPTTMLPSKAQDPVSNFVVDTPDISAFSHGLAQPWRAQVGHLTVTAAESTSDPVSTDY